MTNGSSMNNAQCPWSILQYFWPALRDNWSWKPICGLFESGCFTQVLLYNYQLFTTLGAFCNTFDLHWAIICLENQFVVFLRVAVLHRFYCIIISYLPPTDIIWASTREPVFENRKCADQPAHLGSLISAFVILFVAEQAGLNLSLSETPTGFLMPWPMLSNYVTFFLVIPIYPGMVSTLHRQMTRCHQMSHIMSYNMVVLYIWCHTSAGAVIWCHISSKDNTFYGDVIVCTIPSN